MAHFREQMEAQPVLYTTCTTTSLSSVTFGNERFHKSAELALLVESENGQGKHSKKEVCTYRISLCLPVSMTHVISGMVIPGTP
jgi:hypothetical protein